MGVRWNDELAREEALKHSTKMSLWEQTCGCYHYINRNNLWSLLAPHIPIIYRKSNKRINKPKEYIVNKWTDELALTEALKYTTRSEFHDDRRGCYSYLAKNNLIEQACSHMLVRLPSYSMRKYFENNPIEGAKAGIFYVIHFVRDDGLEFIKIGRTEKSIQERYKDKQYRRYTLNIITEFHTTNLISSQIEDNFLTINQHNRFRLDNDIEFDGYTETLKVELKTQWVELEELHQLTKIKK